MDEGVVGERGGLASLSDQGPRPPSEEGQPNTLTHLLTKYYKGAVFLYLNYRRVWWGGQKEACVGGR